MIVLGHEQVSFLSNMSETGKAAKMARGKEESACSSWSASGLCFCIEELTQRAVLRFMWLDTSAGPRWQC